MWCNEPLVTHSCTSLPRMMLIATLTLSLSLRRVHAFGRALPLRPTSQQRIGTSSFSQNIVTSRTLSITTSLQAELSREDEFFLDRALDAGRQGFGRTFPNPAVGCVLVNQETNEILGTGFHPRAGYPHAEVFALLEAAGHVPSGVQAAQTVIEHFKAEGKTNSQADQTSADDAPTLEAVQAFSDQYMTEGGPEALFANCFEDKPVTAYVTLEPCCHHGRTPPCATSFALSKVDRVVVGFRDPNPKVDGGGVQVLEDAGVTVDVATGMASQACADLVDSFVKRITPRPNPSSDSSDDEYAWVTGAMRRALRRLAGQLKADDGLTQVNLTGRQKATTEEEVDELDLDPAWMERLDFLLWQKELVNIRLNSAVGKKKLAQRLGQRLANIHGAHLAQTVGHTVLLYRPGIPPFLNLEDLILDQKDEDERKAKATVSVDEGEE